MNAAQMTANAHQAIDSVEMTQDALKVLHIGGVYAYARYPPALHQRRYSRTYGTFGLKLRHLNTINALPAKSRHPCSTLASFCNDIRRCRAERSSRSGELNVFGDPIPQDENDDCQQIQF